MVAMKPQHSKKSPLRFLDLPFDIRREIYTCLLPPATNRSTLWLKESLYKTPPAQGSVLPGIWGRHYIHSRALDRWGLRPHSLSGFWQQLLHADSQDASESRYESLFALRAVCWKVASEVDEILFGRGGVELRVEFGEFFAYFLTKCISRSAALVTAEKRVIPGSGGMFSQPVEASKEISKRYDLHDHLFNWLSKFRRLVFYVHPVHLPQLELLGILLAPGSASKSTRNPAASALSEPQIPDNARDLRFIVCELEMLLENVYRHNSLTRTRWHTSGTGTLPERLFSSQAASLSWPSLSSCKTTHHADIVKESAPAPIFTSAKQAQVGAPDIQIQLEGPGYSIFYKLAFTAQLAVRNFAQDTYHTLAVKGVYVDYAPQTITLDRPEWEPIVAELLGSTHRARFGL